MVAPGGDIHIGWDALNHPGRFEAHSFTLNSVKRRMGRPEAMHWGSLRTYPQEISALILSHLSRLATVSERVIDQAVIAVPAHYDLNQRWATLQAAEIAGFSRVRLVNEATAAAIAYSQLHHREAGGVLVYDLGGGTLDVSLVEWGDGALQVMATSGDGLLGGDDFDQCIVDWMAATFLQEQGVDLRQNPTALGRLRAAAAQAKIDLSTVQQTHISLPYISGPSDSHHLEMTLTRPIFEELVAPLADRVVAPCRQVLADSKRIARSDLEAIMIGGQTRMPWVRQQIAACLDAHALPMRSIARDDLVALGAALLADMLGGGRSNLLLLDVTPQTLGVETQGGKITPIIRRNAAIPHQTSKVFRTTSADQTEARICVYEGEGAATTDATLLGTVVLGGIRPAESGEAEIHVTFDVDVGGNLEVTAAQAGTSKSISARIEAPSRLNPAQINVLRGQVAAVLAAADERAAQTHSAHLEQIARDRAQACRDQISRLIEYDRATPPPGTDQLAGAAVLIEDYLSRGADRDSLERLLSGVYQTYDEALLTWLETELRAASASQAVSGWLVHTGAVWERPDELAGALDALRTTVEADSLILAGLRDLERRPTANQLACALALRLSDCPAALVCLQATLRSTLDVKAHAVARPTRGAGRRPWQLIYLAGIVRWAVAPEARAVAARWMVVLLRGQERAFLMRYLARENDLRVTRWLKHSLLRMPPGSWLRWLRQDTADDRREIERRPAARRLVGRHLVWIVANGTAADRQAALIWLRKWRLDELLDELLALLQTGLDVDTRCELIRILATTGQANIIAPLFQALADPTPQIRQTALVVLDPYRARMSREQRRLLSVARRVWLDGRRLRWRDRLSLRILREHPKVARLADLLQQEGDDSR